MRGGFKGYNLLQFYHFFIHGALTTKGGPHVYVSMHIHRERKNTTSRVTAQIPFSYLMSKKRECE